jgi:hypothetical protein
MRLAKADARSTLRLARLVSISFDRRSSRTKKNHELDSFRVAQRQDVTVFTREKNFEGVKATLETTC